MTPDDVRWWLLVLAAEDYCSLAESLWDFGWPDHPLPGVPDEQSVRDMLWQLMSEGLIELYWCEEIYGDTSPIARASWRTVFEDPESWEAPKDGVRGVRFATSPAGDLIVQQRLAGSDAD